MKLFRTLILIAGVLFWAKPAEASSFSVLIGDRDWFGSGAVPPGGLGPWPGYPGGTWDQRSAQEIAGTSGAQLTDVYSALYYYGAGSGCDPLTDPGCSPNGSIGSFVVPFTGTMETASITLAMGDFECTPYGAMNVSINGIPIPFCFDDGFGGMVERTFTLTPEMIAAANLTGEIRMTFDHTGGYDANGVWHGSYDYIAFDFFQLDAEVAPPVPEPATFALLGLGLVGLVARKRFKR